MNNLSYRQIIAIGVAFVFGLPIGVGLAVWHSSDDGWLGIISGILVLLLLAFVAQWWTKRKEKGG